MDTEGQELKPEEEIKENNVLPSEAEEGSQEAGNTPVEVITTEAAEETVTGTDEAPAETEDTAETEVAAEPAEPAGKKHRSKIGKILLIAGISLLGLILTAGILVFLYFNRLYRLSNYQDETSVVEETLTEDESEEEEEEAAGETLSEEELAALAEKMKAAQEAAREARQQAEAEKETEEEYSLREEGIQNILLIGMDEAGGNSDAIIICSIDYENRKITLTSIMRDTAAVVPGYGVRKINSAAAIAGPPLLVETVEQNFMIDIDNYAMVNFKAMKAVIDALGGVDMYITVQEAEFMKIEIPEDRVIHMTGKMAVRHSRDRTSGGSDYGRVQRQKNVLLAIIDKARSGGLGDLTKAAETVLPYITHDFSRADLLSIMMNLPELVNFEFEQARIPFDGMYHNEGEFLIVDTAATVAELKKIIYGEE